VEANQSGLAVFPVPGDQCENADHGKKALMVDGLLRET